MRVQDIMTKDVSCCFPGTNAAVASEIMWTRNCGVLPIVEGGRVVGMITDRDLFIALGTSNRNAADLSVGEIVLVQREMESWRAPLASIAPIPPGQFCSRSGGGGRECSG